jgi:hypothetical protein
MNFRCIIELKKRNCPVLGRLYHALGDSMRKLDEIADEARQIETDDHELVTMYESIEKMVQSDWELSPEVQEQASWARPVPSTDPSDAVRAGTNIMSGREPTIHFLPMAPNTESKKFANDMERVLKTWYNQASRRRPTPLTADICYSAFTYGAVCAQVIYLPYQMRIAKKSNIGGSLQKWKMASQYGPYVVNLYNPKQVHARHSDLMLEKVVAVKVQSIDDIISYWGDGIKELNELAARLGKSPKERRMTLYDSTTYDEKCVFATLEAGGDPIEIYLEEMELPFFPWVCRFGGTTLEVDPEKRVKPLLGSIYKTGLWDTLNVARSLAISDMIVRAGQPRSMSEGPDPDSIEKEYVDPGGSVRVPAGHKYTPLPSEPIDVGMLTVVDGLDNDVIKTTIPRMMQDPNQPANIQFATLNSSIQMGLTVIRPFSLTAEQSIADIMTLMTRWFVHNGRSETLIGTTKRDLGEQHVVDPKTIDIKNMLITVELNPDVPTDKLQRINGAATANQQLDYPKEEGLNDIGVEDPQYAMETTAKERLFSAQVEAQIAQINAEVTISIQEMQAMSQMRLQQAMAGAQGGAPGGGTGGGGAPVGSGEQPQDMNLAAPTNGAMPAQMNDPAGMTREAVTGQTQGGEAIA